MGIANVSNNMAASYQMMTARPASGASTKQVSMPRQGGDKVQLSPEAVAAMNGSPSTGATAPSGQSTLAQPSQAIAKYLGC